MKNIIFTLLLIISFCSAGFAQQPESADITREQILSMSVDELSDLPFEDLVKVMEVMGVSSMDELTNLLINKDVSSASKKVENAFDSPLSSTVLTRQEIEMSGATTIEEALRLVPGVIVREKTNGNYDVHLRGLDNLPDNNMLLYSESTNALLMVDGRPMFNYVHGAIVWESLPIGFEDIDRIEVVRGAASALYGPNAVNGVINILTAKTGKDSNLVSGNFQSGTQNTYTGNLALRKEWNRRFSAAVTTNFQSRQRDRSELYIFGNGDDVREGFYTLDEYDNFTVQGLLGERDLLAPEHDVNTLFPDPSVGRNNIGVNAYMSYLAASNINFDLSAGFQDSYVNSSRVGDTPTSFSGRKSKTSYANLLINWDNLALQTNYTGGTQDYAPGESGFKIDMGQFNASAEYNLQIRKFNLRPGISFQSVYYDDSPYLQGEELGYFNGKKELNTLAASLRSEFLMFNKLRLIAALRAEKYNYPDAWYPSWQLAGTYPISDNQTIRAVYSRANRSSFIINSHSDYLWDRTSRNMMPQEVHFGANKDYDLMTTDMVEIGYRIRPTEKILIDAELFASENKNFGALLPYRSTMAFPMATEDINIQSFAQFAQMLQQGQALPSAQMSVLYQNKELTARQVGASINIDWIISEKLIAKVHGTIQETILDNYSGWNSAKTGELQLNEASEEFENLMGELYEKIMSGQDPFPLNSDYTEQTTSDTQNADLKDDVTHKSTPSFWGMASLTYRPIQKLEFTSNGYYMGEQTFNNQYATAIIDAQIILNAKASYKPSKQLELFINARNILNDGSREFAFMDEIGGIYLLGIKFNY